jgi:hypothetical protein
MATRRASDSTHWTRCRLVAAVAVKAMLERSKDQAAMATGTGPAVALAARLSSR